ncbi:MAG: ABC transporter ATP-binding protein [Granulosicoccus sp.]
MSVLETTAKRQALPPDPSGDPVSRLGARIAGWFETRVEPFPDDWQGQTPPGSFFGFVSWQLRGYWPWVIAIFFFSLFFAWVEVSLIGLLGQVIDWLASAGDEPGVFDEDKQAVTLAVTWRLLFFAIGGFAFGLLLHQVLFGNLPMAVRWRGHRHLLTQSYAFFQDEFSGRVSQKLMQSSLAAREVVIKLVDVFAYVGAWILGAIGVVALIDPWYIIPFVLWIVCFLLIMYLVLPELAKRSEETADAQSDMVGRLTDSYGNILTVKLFAQGQHELGYGRDGMARHLSCFNMNNRVITFLSTVRDLLNSLFIIAVLLIGLLSWSKGSGSPGDLAVALGLALRINGLGQWVMWELAGLSESIGTLRDGIGMIAKEPEFNDHAYARSLKVSPRQIEFDNVRFHYGKEAGTFDQLNLDIAAGEKVGIIGRSGAGKSTVTHLLLRLFDTESGSIRIDGQDISRVTQRSLRHQIAMVSQEISLMHRSIHDNIAYGRPDATRGEVIEAARRAHAHDFIQDLEDVKHRKGYEAHAGERGVKLSGGQRQRVAIARVFLKNAPILVMDEATSALDSEVEAAIQENLAALMQDKTVIAIAHRLSTIAAMDKLVVLDQGEIVETGTHQELLANQGLYAELWAHQSGGFLGVS